MIIASHRDGALDAIFDEGVFKSILSIFITSAVLNFLQGNSDTLVSLIFILACHDFSFGGIVLVVH